MSFTIGDKAHKLFPLAETPGRVTHITTLPQSAERVDVEELTDFDFLAEGESATIDSSCVIEVVDFSHETYRGRQSHFLRITRVGVARGAELKGPIAWRTSDAMEVPSPSKRSVPRLLLPAVALGCLLPLGLPVQEAYLSGTLKSGLEDLVMENVWWIIGATAFLCLSLANYSHRDAIENLEKDPSLEVLTPARRLWA